MARKKQSLEDVADIMTFARSAARKYGLSEDRMMELYDILKEAYFSSTTGRLGVRKAASLVLRFVGTALDVDEGKATFLS